MAEPDLQAPTTPSPQSIPTVQPSLQRLLANVPGVMFQLRREPDGQQRFLYASAGCRELLELEPAEMLRVFDLIPTEAAEALEQALQASARSLTRLEYEYPIVTPSGQRKWLKVVSQPQQQADGAIEWDGIIMDITPRKHTEAALRQSEERLQRFSDNLPGVLYQFHLEPDGTMSFPYASQGSREIYELEPSEFIQCLALVHPDDRAALDAAIAKSAVSQQQFAHEHRIVTPSGTPKWVKVISNPTPQPNGSILWDGLVLDITQRKQTEGQLRLSEQRFRQIFQSLPLLAMQIYDRERRVIDWNGASEQIYGYSREEAIGQKLEDLIIPPELCPDTIAAVDAWMVGGPALPASELNLCHKDGSRVVVYSTHFLLPNAQGEPEMYCLDIDLRDRHQAETELKQSK